MYSTLPEYINDISRISSLLEMNIALKDFSGAASIEVDTDDYFEQSKIVHDLTQKNRANLVVLNGTLLLFIAGRFESFVRSTFEELCDNLASGTDRFKKLPKDMRENLLKYTAEVISSPRKYGHGDQGVKAFIKILSDNLVDDKDLEEINSRCISITTENMRPTILSDLFKRIGIRNLWEKIGQQAEIQIMYETTDPNKAKNEAEKFLNIFMDKRNSIAHPTASITWPDQEYLKTSILYFLRLGEVIDKILAVIELDIKRKMTDQN